MILGDQHNFGQAVRRITLPDGSFWFQKPRPVYWEWLFFGVTSPLADFFKQKESIFGLAIEFENNFLWGSSKLIEESQRGPPSDKQLFGFGYLLGYAYTFGIQDLFSENVIRTEHGLQVIDAEVVLSKFVLPQESFLLAFRGCAFERSALSHLLKSEAEITQPVLEKIVDGFCEALSEFNQNGSKIVEALSLELATKNVPVRVLLRDTRSYRDWSTVTPDIPWLAEEVRQLERGDVPYFFKYVGRPELYWFSGEQTIKPVLAYEAFEKGVGLIGMSPNELLDVLRIRITLFPNGVLFLLKKYVSKDWTGDFKFPHFEAMFTAEKISLKSWWGEYAAKR